MMQLFTAKKMMAWVLICSMLITLTSCNPEKFVTDAVETAQEKVQVLREKSVKAGEGIYESYSKDKLKEWLTEQVCEKRSSVSVAYRLEDANTTSDTVMKDVHEVLESSIAYQYMGLQSKISIRSMGSRITIDMSFTYRKGAKDVRKIKVFRTKKQIYRYIAKRIKKGKDSITFGFDPKKVSKKQLNNLTYAAYWNEGRYMTISPENRSTLLCGNKKTEYSIYTNTYNYQGAGKKFRKKAAKATRKEIKKIVRQVKKEMGSSLGKNEKTYKKIVEILSKRIRYDHKLEKMIDKKNTANNKIRNNRSTYGALVKGKTVCSGYAASFKAVCDELHLPSWSVIGKAEGESHAWNMVIAGDGKLYYVDVTFADQDGSGTVNEKYSFGSTAEYKEWKRTIYKSCYIPARFKKRM